MQVQSIIHVIVKYFQMAEPLILAGLKLGAK